MSGAHTKEAPRSPPLQSTCELADILRAHGPDYLRSHPLPPSHRKVIRAITRCRTSWMGGHLERCDSCGYERPAYNSCRNRHCPKCQSMAKARWLEARQAELLPVGYFHVVFTLPHQINPLALHNKKVIYDILFRSAAQTLQEFGADPRHGLEGRMGFTSILHTWDQLLRYHVHLHCLVAGGALPFDGKRWRSAPDGFLFPVRALSGVFRGKFTHALRRAFEQGEITVPGEATTVEAKKALMSLIRSLHEDQWVVYCKRPFSGPQGVLDYLARYTHRVAISNDRIISLQRGQVTFTYRDRARGNRRRKRTVPAAELIRRFLLHVLPDSYVRVRHFGFLANRCKGQLLPLCRRLLGCRAESESSDAPSTRELLMRLTGIDLRRCPRCKNGTMMVLRTLPAIPHAWHLFSSGIPPPI